ncbi:MAG: PAS domain-containing protein [Bacteroidota bacterium]
MHSTDIHPNSGFLKGGGETGALIRSFNWLATPLGSAEAWPAELKSALRLMLDAPIAMCIMWGKDYIQLYNDAFIPSFGNTRHPSAMGQPVKNTSQRWPVVEELFKRVMSGETIYHQDSQLIVDKNGFPEVCYFNVSYIPIYIQDGTVGGIQCITLETTDKVNALNNIKESEARMRSMIEEAPVATALFVGKDMLIELANQKMIDIWGKGPSVLGMPLAEALPELKGQSFLEILDDVFTTGKSFEATQTLCELVVGGKLTPFYFDFTYKAVRNAAGEIYGVMDMAVDVTAQVYAKQKLEKSQQELLALFEESPVGIATIGKEQLVFKMANSFYGSLVGRKPHEIINKPLLEALPELKGQGFDLLLQGVLDTGVPYIAKEIGVDLVRNGVMEKIHVDLIYQPIEEDGVTTGILVVATDVTEQVSTRKKIEESESKLRNVIQAAPAGIGLFVGRDLIIENPNQTFIDIVGKGHNIVGLPLREAMPELITEGQAFLKILDDVYTTGVPFVSPASLVKIVQNGVLNDNYYNISYTPLRNADGEIYAILDIAVDVTEQIKSQQKMKESEAHLQLMRDTVPAMIFYLDSDQRYLSYNIVFQKWFGVNEHEALGKTVRQFIGEEAYAKTHPNLVKAYAGEQVRYEMFAPTRMNGDKWLSIVYTPHTNSDGRIMGIIVHATDITEHVLNRKKIEESELFSRDVIHNSPIAKVVYTGADLTITIVNENMLQLLGRDDSILGKPFAEAIPELAGSSLEKKMIQVLTTGETFVQAEEQINLVRFGKPYTGYYSYTYKALRKVSGEIYGMMATATEITDHVVARHKIEQKEKELRDLITAAPIGICVVSGTPVMVEDVNERFLEISGKTREQYAGNPYWTVLHEVAHIFEPVLTKVFETGIKYTTEENEMVLVRNGVPEHIVLTFEYIPVMDGARVAKVIVMAVEVTHQVETRKEIEAAVVERTRELDESNLRLKRSNAELEQFAYIASHDLQEPIRKISTFTQLLEHSIPDISDKTKDYISKIYGSTDRMTKLVRDVLAYSQISAKVDGFEKVNLSEVIKNVKTDFELLIEQRQAVIEDSDLPIIEAIPSQMIQLFSNLMSNSLKYIRPEIRPVIKITLATASAQEVLSHPQLDQLKKYHHIQFSDNGIGFDQEHADRIFKIFQRLHAKTEFEGTGIGLSICRKIVNTHEGHIAAAVGDNGGAVFHILLPQ